MKLFATILALLLLGGGAWLLTPLFNIEKLEKSEFEDRAYAALESFIQTNLAKPEFSAVRDAIGARLGRCEILERPSPTREVGELRRLPGIVPFNAPIEIQAYSAACAAPGFGMPIFMVPLGPAVFTINRRMNQPLTLSFQKGSLILDSAKLDIRLRASGNLLRLTSESKITVVFTGNTPSTSLAVSEGSISVEQIPIRPALGEVVAPVLINLCDNCVIALGGQKAAKGGSVHFFPAGPKIIPKITMEPAPAPPAPTAPSQAPAAPKTR